MDLPISGTTFDVVGMLSLTMRSSSDIESNVVIPSVTFSSRSPLVEPGEKKPTNEMSVIMSVGTTRFTI